MTSTPARAESVDAVLARAVAGDVTPGAAAVVIAADGRRGSWCAGRLHRGANAPLVDVDTVWDLASLTKLLSTTLIAARAIEAGRARLEDVAWPERWPAVTVAHLLRHDGGLVAWRPLYEEARRQGVCGLRAGARVVLDAALATAPSAAPGARIEYSDLGFIALGAWLEERLSAPLDALFRTAADDPRAYGPTGLRFVRLDVDGFHPSVPLVAPTERCAWRRRALHGQVHDDNCFAMGGVAGHAGLFGSLRDVEAAARFFLRALTAPGEETIAAFASDAASTERGLGFDRATRGGTTGDALSPRAVGHLGFTGTSLWIDPEPGRAAAYVLLTNRVHESRDHKERILEVRREFHRAAAAWVGR